MLLDEPERRVQSNKPNDKSTTKIYNNTIYKFLAICSQYRLSVSFKFSMQSRLKMKYLKVDTEIYKVPIYVRCAHMVVRWIAVPWFCFILSLYVWREDAHFRKMVQCHIPPLSPTLNIFFYLRSLQDHICASFFCLLWAGCGTRSVF